ncbi:MAG TPA: preprotein translocase subunit YajC [Planctomycetota bacterium]|nr:preprotein translocase subunit YajC [Planctomycetota bacterium]
MHRLVLLLSLIVVAVAGDGDRGTTTGLAATAGGGGGGAPGDPGMPWQQFLIPVMIIAFMWFILIRPQRKEEKKRKDALASLKRGDKVLIGFGGLIAEVASVGEQSIDVRAGQDGKDVVLTFSKGNLQIVPVTADEKGK